jgi:plastocyanin
MAKTRAGSGQLQPNLKFSGSEGIVIPVGPTSARNPTPNPGEVRFNTDLNTFEGYTGEVWGGMGPFPFVKTQDFAGDGSTYTFELDQVTSNPDDITVVYNGVQLRPGIDFQLVGQRFIVFEEDDGTIRAPEDGSSVTVRYFVPITSASVIANSISVEELAVVPGAPGQLLSIDQNQALIFTNQLPTDSVSLDQLIITGQGGIDGQPLLKDGNGFSFGEISDIAENSISVRELKVSDGEIGQVLATDGQGNLTFITVGGIGGGRGEVTNFFDLNGQIGFGQIPDNIINIQKLAVNDGNPGQVLSTDGNGNLVFTDTNVSFELIDDVTPQLGGALDTNNNNIIGEGNIILDAGPLLNPTARKGKVYFQNTWNFENELPSANDYQGMFVYVDFNDKAYYSRNGQWTRILDEANDTLSLIQNTDDLPEGNSNLYYTSARFTSDFILKSIDDLVDVNTTAITPNVGQALVWNGTDWTPGNVSGTSIENFKNIAVSGQTTLVADNNDDTLTFAAGTGISLTTNATTDTLQITNSSPNVDQDIFASIVTDSGQVTASSPTGTLNITGGTDISTQASGNNIILNYTGSPGLTNAFTTIDTQGGALTASGSDTLTLVAGANISFVINQSNNTLQIDASGSGGSGGVGAGTAGQLGYYATTSSTISPTGNNLTWDGTTLSVNALSVATSLGNITTGDITADTITADSIQNTGTGFASFTSASDFEFDAANGAGELRVLGGLYVSTIAELSTIQNATSLTIDSPSLTITASNKFVDPANIDRGAAADGQYLTWDTSGGGWIPTTPPTPGDPDQALWFTFTSDNGQSSASNTTDTFQFQGGTKISTSIIGDVLRIDYDGSAIGDLTDVDTDTTAPTNGDVLTYNGSEWVPGTAGGAVETLPAITKLAVTPNGASAYRFDQYGATVDNPTIYAISGTTIAFDLDGVTGAHPFQIETTGGALYNEGLVHIATDGTVSTGSNAQAKTTGTLYWKIPIGTTGNYAYQCTFHSVMRGTITIKDFATL